VSHFDVSAIPNLLMEPSISGSLAAATDVDLTDDLLWDIGWDGQISCPVDANSAPTVSVFGCDTGVENRKGEYVVFPKKIYLPGNFGAQGQVAGGCYLADVVDSCTPLISLNGAGKEKFNHLFGQFQSCISHVTAGLVAQGNLTQGEKGAIQSCAASGQ
jgi:hypothetical protein